MRLDVKTFSWNFLNEIFYNEIFQKFYILKK
jgi:hypothetical protein